MIREVATASAVRLEHPALAGGEGVELESAHCTDRQKVGMVLQGAALLSLCEAAGWSLAAGWNGARVAPGGRLTGISARPGRDRTPAQPRLCDLLQRLFRTRGRVAGRGEARRAAREIAERWSDSLVPLSNEDAISLLFEAAPFLWEPDLAHARSALRGAFERDGERIEWIAGPAEVRARLGDATATAEASRSPEALLAAARWSAAVRAWRAEPPRSAADRLGFAKALHATGRFLAAQLMVAEDESTDALALRASSRHLLGELATARELVDRLHVRELSTAERIEHGDVALHICKLAGEGGTARDWVALALRNARPGLECGRARLLSATRALDENDLDGATAQLESAAVDLEGTSESWRLLRFRSWLPCEQNDAAGIIDNSRALLASRRRRMTLVEAGRAWNNLGFGYLVTQQFTRAERAFVQSVRLLRRCDGPLSITLAQCNLAEARLRAGKLFEVDTILRASILHNRRSGNHQGLAADEEIAVRWEIVRGNFEAALVRAERALDRSRARGEERPLPGLAALAARAAGWLERREDAARWVDLAGEAGERELEPEEAPGYFALAGRFDLARERARGNGQAAIWAALLRGDSPARDAFAALAALEPFRRARLVLDFETIAPGATPPAILAEAAALFRRQGSPRNALRLEPSSREAWWSLRQLVEAGGDSAARRDATVQLFGRLGHPEAGVSWRNGDGRELVWIEAGEGADDELSTAASRGVLILRAARIDEPLRAIAALLARDTADLGMADRSADEMASGPSAGRIQGRSAKLLAAIERLRQYAASDMPVLVLGESGTGKELAAQEVRRASARADRPWVTVNCAALSETLLLSDLFGHARGAFTGADRVHEGVFETAHGGTVFLDEIGDLPPVAQGNLLRVLQEGEVRRLGESIARKVDFRLVTATHRDLAAMVRDGKFRQDLYYRLKVCTVTLPPLRERGGDVEALAESFLETERKRLGRPQLRFQPEALRRLTLHSWPGNVRELQHAVRAAAALAGDGPIGRDALEIDSAGEEPAASDYHREVEEFRRSMVRRAVLDAHGNRAAAARQLGISRQALSYLVRELGLEEPH